MYVFEPDERFTINPMKQILISKQICLKITVLGKKEEGTNRLNMSEKCR